MRDYGMCKAALIIVSATHGRDLRELGLTEVPFMVEAASCRLGSGCSQKRQDAASTMYPMLPMDCGISVKTKSSNTGGHSDLAFLDDYTRRSPLRES